MNIKNTILIFLIILCGCQPEQTKWPESRSVKRSTPGQVVFEAFANNIAQQRECGPQRNNILKKKKSLFIRKFDELLNTFSGHSQKENIHLLATYIKKNENTDKILKAADFIEKKSADFAKLDLKNLKEIISADDRAVERLILNLIHNNDFEKLLDLAAPANSNLHMMQYVSKFQTLADQFPEQINLHALAQKFIKLIDDSNEYKKLALKVANLMGKFSEPAEKKAAQELKDIISNVYPEITVDNMVTWIGLLKSYPSSLNFPAGLTRLLISTGKFFNITPGFLADFIDRVTADEKIYQSLMDNTKILYQAGIMDDITDLAPEADKLKTLVKKEYFDDLKKALNIAKKLLPPDQPIFDAPIMVISQILLEVLATTKQRECRIPHEKTDLSTTIESWAKSLVTFMKDSEKGLPHILSIIRYNL